MTCFKFGLLAIFIYRYRDFWFSVEAKLLAQLLFTLLGPFYIEGVRRGVGGPAGSMVAAVKKVEAS